jgi:hypothetical protein
MAGHASTLGTMPVDLGLLANASSLYGLVALARTSSPILAPSHNEFGEKLRLRFVILASRGVFSATRRVDCSSLPPLPSLPFAAGSAPA